MQSGDAWSSVSAYLLENLVRGVPGGPFVRGMHGLSSAAEEVALRGRQGTVGLEMEGGLFVSALDGPYDEDVGFFGC